MSELHMFGLPIDALVENALVENALVESPCQFLPSKASFSYSVPHTGTYFFGSSVSKFTAVP